MSEEKVDGIVGNEIDETVCLISLRPGQSWVLARIEKSKYRYFFAVISPIRLWGEVRLGSIRTTDLIHFARGFTSPTLVRATADHWRRTEPGSQILVLVRTVPTTETIAKAAAEQARKLRIHLSVVRDRMIRAAKNALETISRDRSKRNHHQRGTMLIEMLLVMSLLLVLFAISAPSFTAMKRSQQQRSALDLMQHVSRAEIYHTQIYSDGFRSPGALGVVAFPKTCEGSGLLGGMDSLTQSNQYNFTFTLGLTLAPLAPGCIWQGSTTYQLRAQPIDPANSRSFFLSEDGLVRWSDDPNSPANAASAVWTW